MFVGSNPTLYYHRCVKFGQILSVWSDNAPTKRLYTECVFGFVKSEWTHYIMKKEVYLNRLRVDDYIYKYFKEANDAHEIQIHIRWNKNYRLTEIH